MVGSLHGWLTVLPLCFVCDALCVVSWDAATVAAQAVNEVWEPEAHSQLEKGQKAPGPGQVLLFRSLVLRSLPLSCLLAMWAGPGLGFVNGICAGPSIVWSLAVIARLGLASTGRSLISLSTFRSLGELGNHPFSGAEVPNLFAVFVCFALIELRLLPIGKNSFST